MGLIRISESDNLRSNTVSTREFHTATAKVGKDIIENAEYFTFDHFGWWPRKDQNRLEKIWYLIISYDKNRL